MHSGVHQVRGSLSVDSHSTTMVHMTPLSSNRVNRTQTPTGHSSKKFLVHQNAVKPVICKEISKPGQASSEECG